MKGGKMMIILQEATGQAIKDSKVFISKLKNMKLHLTELLNKKIRLEIEIRSLQKSLENKQKEYENSLRVKLKLESGNILTPDQAKELQANNPQLFNMFIEFDEVSLEIQELLLRPE